MPVQNGLGADEIVARHGDWRMLSSVTFMSGTRHDDTHVEYILDTATWIGPARGTTGDDARAAAGADRVLGAEGRGVRRPAPRAVVEADLQRDGERRRGAHRAAARLPLRGLERPSDLGHLVRDLIDEGKAVAAAAGRRAGEDPWEMNVLATRRGFRHYPSMLEDVEARRPTEIDMITGALVREGERHGVPVPLHTALLPARQGEGGVAGREGLRGRLRRRRLAVRREPRARSTTSRSGPTTSRASTSTRSTATACG